MAGTPQRLGSVRSRGAQRYIVARGHAASFHSFTPSPSPPPRPSPPSHHVRCAGRRYGPPMLIDHRPSVYWQIRQALEASVVVCVLFDCTLLFVWPGLHVKAAARDEVTLRTAVKVGAHCEWARPTPTAISLDRPLIFYLPLPLSLAFRTRATAHS